MSEELLLLWPRWYQDQQGVSGDVAALWRHAREHGDAPNPWFNPERYGQLNPDVAASGEDPINHYRRQGWREGRAIGSELYGIEAYSSDERLQLDWLVWPDWYIGQLPSPWRAGLEPGEAVEHYLRLGVMAGLDPNPLFKTMFYGQRYPDLLEAGCDLLLHFLRYGCLEGRSCHPHLNWQPIEMQQWFQGQLVPGWPLPTAEVGRWRQQLILEAWAAQEVLSSGSP